MSLEHPPRPSQRNVIETLTPDDVEADLEEVAPELLVYFRKLPKELWVRHFKALEKLADGAENAEVLKEQRDTYMAIIVESREKAIVEFAVSDDGLREVWSDGEGAPEQVIQLLRETFAAEGNSLGAGYTARVKSMKIPDFDSKIAVKYLLTPTSKTLSVDAEHYILREVETITRVEEHERKHETGNCIRVPHPYFYYKRGKMQSYGMTEIEGVTIETFLLKKPAHLATQDRVLSSLRQRYGSEEARNELFQELDRFIDAMHEVCLHGDIKDKNIMIDVDGTFFLIDFGQSVSMFSETEETRDRFDELREEERKSLHNRFRAVLQQALDTQ